MAARSFCKKIKYPLFVLGLISQGIVAQGLMAQTYVAPPEFTYPHYQPVQSTQPMQHPTQYQGQQQAQQQVQHPVQYQPTFNSDRNFGGDRNTFSGDHNQMLYNRLHAVNHLAREKNYQEALREINQVIQMYPDNPRLYHVRAHIYSALKQFALAAGDLDYVIDRSPKEANLYVERGTALLQAKFYKEANSDVKQALKLNPDSVEARELLILINQKIHKK